MSSQLLSLPQDDWPEIYKHTQKAQRHMATNNSVFDDSEYYYDNGCNDKDRTCEWDL